MIGNSSIAILFTVIGTFNSLVTFIGKSRQRVGPYALRLSSTDNFPVFSFPPFFIRSNCRSQPASSSPFPPSPKFSKHPSDLSLPSIFENPTGIAEYTFFLMATVGIFILRRRYPPHHNTTTTTTTTTNVPHRTYTFIVIIFCIFATCLVVRGVITDPMQGVAIFVLGLLAWIVFRRKRS